MMRIVYENGQETRYEPTITRHELYRMIKDYKKYLKVYNWTGPNFRVFIKNWHWAGRYTLDIPNEVYEIVKKLEENLVEVIPDCEYYF